MKIDFVKHGKTQYGAVAGRVSAQVLEEGVEETRKTLINLSDHYDGLYSSDQMKCRQTAEILNEKFNLEIKYDSRLRERDFGSLAGKELIEMDATGEIKEKDKNQEYDYRPFGGESVEDVKERVFSFVNDLMGEGRCNRTVLVITSGGVIRLLHKILDNQVYEKIVPSSVHSFEFSKAL